MMETSFGSENRW